MSTEDKERSFKSTGAAVQFNRKEGEPKFMFFKTMNEWDLEFVPIQVDEIIKAEYLSLIIIPTDYCWRATNRFGISYEIHDKFVKRPDYRFS